MRCHYCNARDGEMHTASCQSMAAAIEKEAEMSGHEPEPKEEMVGDLYSTKPGTCARKNVGKVMLHLLPMPILSGVARVLEWGIQKYAAWNWSKGGDFSQAIDCALRHIFKWWYCGEDSDKESGLHHLDHAICNLIFVRHWIRHWPDGDDRPPADLTGFGKWLDDLTLKTEVKKIDD